jgi:tetratricopeptide (TPR) repeat protein
VDTEPARQLEWDERAIAYLERSDQADAKRWEGALRNNVGYARHLRGEYEEALAQFRLSRAAHERSGRVRNVRIADWMIARTLRAQNKYEQALAIQLELERAWDADGEPDPYVYEELEHLYRALGDEARARRYGAKLKARKQ